MLLNVFDTDKKRVIEIDSSKMNPETHVHLVTKEKFTIEQLDSFGYSHPVAPVEVIEEVVEPTIEPIVEPVVEPVVEVIEEVPTENTVETAIEELVDEVLDYNAMTKAELYDYALTLGIELDTTMTKANMIEDLTTKLGTSQQ